MLHKIDHVGIAVTDIEAAIKTYEGLGFTLKGRDRVDSQKVETAFFQIGESCIELIAATEADSPIAKFIEKNAGKGGLQQLAFSARSAPITTSADLRDCSNVAESITEVNA